MSQDDRALTAKSVAHLCGLFSRDAWHAEHVTHSDLASIVNSFAEVPAVLEAEHCGDFTKTARRALRELAKPVEAHAEAFTPAEVSVVYSSFWTFWKPPIESSFFCSFFSPIKVSLLVAPFEVPSGYLQAAEIDSFHAGLRRGSIVRARVRRVLGAPSDGRGFKPRADRTLTLQRPR